MYLMKKNCFGYEKEPARIFDRFLVDSKFYQVFISIRKLMTGAIDYYSPVQALLLQTRICCNRNFASA